MSVADRYATFANFGGGREILASRPLIKTVVISDSIKRRLPTKHYVYKMEVEWTNGTSSIVYRRYSMFFDFQVKLQELYTSICNKNLQFVDEVPNLPELPGKILFGRSQTHQVAEKRRVKIEEFCQQIVALPAEISQTNLVMGFFNTWPDDTMLPSHRTSVSSSISSSSVQISPFGSTAMSNFPASPTPPSPTSVGTPVFSSPSSSEAVISHPDEMENLEQYRVLADYQRKDSHQVNLTADQVVHVIEKHDTGWWMVMSEDEQGYAPAAYLEPVEGRTSHDHMVETENSSSSEVFEAMESYSAQNEDEVSFFVGDKVEVICKSMDGWWKIRCNGKVGVAPSALIRRRIDIPPQPSTNVTYESHKSIYEGLNIHRPPPRRNTIERNHGYSIKYDIPRAAKKTANPLLDDEEAEYVEPPIELNSEDEEDFGYARVPREPHIIGYPQNWPKVSKISGSPPKNGLDYWSQNASRSSTSPPQEEPQSTSNGPTSFSPAHDLPQTPEGEEGMDSIYSEVPELLPYELEQGPEQWNLTTSSLYQSIAEASSEAEAVRASGEAEEGKDSGGEVKSLSSHGRMSLSPVQSLGSTADKESDYVDIENHDEYVDPEELMQGEGSAPEPSTPRSPIPSYKPLPKPPLPASNPPKKKLMMVASQYQDTDTGEDEYIPMEPIYTEPPTEETDAHDTPITNQPQQQKQPKKQPPKQQAPSSTPASNPSTPTNNIKVKKSSPFTNPYSKQHKAMRDRIQISSPVLVNKNKQPLSRAKSMDELLSTGGSRESSPMSNGSPPEERKFHPGGRIGSPARVPILPPPFPVGRGSGVGFSDGKAVPSAVKPKPGILKAGRSKKSPDPRLTPTKMIHSSSDVSQRLQQSLSPPRAPSPDQSSFPRTNIASHSLEKPTDVRNPPFMHLQTYIAVSSHQSQIGGCLSFQEGDKCVLLRKTQDGWWLVNIGGREGWTPEGFWKEETWTGSSTIARPPGPPPTAPPQPPLDRKPRSHTVAVDSNISSTDLASSVESSLEMSYSSWSSSVETSGERELKSTPPPVPPQSTKPSKRVAPPPKPRGFPVSNSPWRNAGEKPAVPLKPAAISSTPLKHQTRHQSPSCISPPQPSKTSLDHTPSPPPPLASRKAELEDSGSTYVMLEDARTPNLPLESSPWFVGKMERVQAEQFLMEHGRQREFLVRERAAKDGYYALSLRYHYSCKHFNIDPAPDGQFSIGTLIFPTIGDIIHHYQNNSLFIHEGQHVTLSSPARRRTRGADMRPHS